MSSDLEFIKKDLESIKKDLEFVKQEVNSLKTFLRKLTTAWVSSLQGQESDKHANGETVPFYKPQPEKSETSVLSALLENQESDKPASDASAPPLRERLYTSAVPSKTAEPEEKDARSGLYSSEEQRNKRKDKGQDQFLDVNQDSYERMLLDEKVSLCFEKYGNWASAPYLLTDNNELFLNFHRFNDSRPPVPEDLNKTLNVLFEVHGNLPGKVKRCVPAQMSLKGNNYFVSKKGILELGA